MKKLIILLVLSLLSCKPAEKMCNENPEFKEKFFSSIKTLEDAHTIQNKERTRQEYDDALNFLAKYVYVNYAETANYRRVLSHGVVEDSKKEWLKWYEENKCNNIQFK